MSDYPERPDRATYWRRWYLGLVMFLLLQILLYSLITNYYS